LPPGGHPLTPAPAQPTFINIVQSSVVTAVAAAALSAQQGGNFQAFLSDYLANPEDAAVALSRAAQSQRARTENGPFNLQKNQGDFFDALGGASCGLNGLCAFGNPNSVAYQQSDSAAQSAAPVVNGAILIAGLGAAIKDLGTVGLRALITRLGSADASNGLATGDAGILANQAAGNAARDAIAARYAGARTEVTFQTALGARRVDVLTQEGLAIESKVGYTSLTQSARSQIAKDQLLMQNPQISGVEWEFGRSAVTGQAGPSGPLAAALNRAGIPWSTQP
jgi:hypothetical protein